jgi:hypothetical protein
VTQILHYILNDADGKKIGRWGADGRMRLTLVGVKDGEVFESNYTLHQREGFVTTTRPTQDAAGNRIGNQPTSGG